MTRTRIPCKWCIFFLLIILAAAIILFLPGYGFTGLAVLGCAALIPIFSGIRRLKRRHRLLGKILFTCVSAFFVLFLALGIFTWSVIAGSARGTGSPTADYLIVLGAGVNGTSPSQSLMERINAAYDYLTAHPDVTCVVSGGQGSGEEISEAECMYRSLTAVGIDPERIWLEDRATSTLENLKFSLDIIQQRTGSRPDTVAIVSSEYHLYRASMFASWLSLEAELVPARTEMWTLRWNYYLREVFAVWYYFIFGGHNYA